MRTDRLAWSQVACDNLKKAGATDEIFYYRRVLGKEKYAAHVFIAQYASQEQLKQHWESLNDNIALLYQSNVDSLLERSNFYLCFFLPESLDIIEKEKIENDAYCAKKYIFVSKKELSIEEKIRKINEKIFELTYLEPQDTSETKLISMQVQNFRIYKGQKNFAFTAENSPDCPASLVMIYAPNGMGKTSICDALEWALTGRIQRLSDMEKLIGRSNMLLHNREKYKSVEEYRRNKEYAYLKIAQRLDDMMQTAGLKVTRTGMDIGRDIAGAAKTTVDAAGTAYRGGKWLGKEVAKGGKFIAGKAGDFGGNVIEFGGKTKNAITDAVNEKKAEVAGGKPEGYTPNNAESTATNRELREKQSETHKQNGRVSIAQKDTQAWQDATTPKEQEKALKKLNENNSNKTGVANMLADQSIVPKGTKVKGFSSENGKLYANTYKKDNAGGIHRSKVELKSEGGQLRAVGASSKLDVSPDGKSATLKTEKGTYKLTQKDSDRRDGKELWEATNVCLHFFR